MCYTNKLLKKKILYVSKILLIFFKEEFIIENQLACVDTQLLSMKSDIVFKAFFSKTGNERFLQSFLGSLLGEELQIKKIIHDSRLEQLVKESKYGILDLDVELESGEILNIEMQLQNYHNIEERATFYASKKIAEQLGPRENYKQLKRVIVISILDYNLTDLPEYITKTVRVADQHRDFALNNIVSYYFIELKKFREQNPDMTLLINQWLAFIDMVRKDLLEMAKKNSKIIREAYGEYEILTGDAEVKRLAEIRLMSQLEEQAALASARDNGTREGLEQGHKIGLEQGHKIGLEQGQKVGLEQAKVEIAQKLLEKNMPIEEIISITGLSEKEILNLKEQFSTKSKNNQK